MKGYIIYNTEDLTKNKRFIKFITETLNEYNIDVELVIIDRVELAELENPDFVINLSLIHICICKNQGRGTCCHCRTKRCRKDNLHKITMSSIR